MIYASMVTTIIATREFVTPVISAMSTIAVIGVLTELANIAAIEIIMNLYEISGSSPKIGITIALNIAPMYAQITRTG